ncbi:ABC transporter ATP-binding protein [Mucilaginibacter sp.]|uniref:ABC transporter ATP-binding protein n=1 Tax=Mucilaginibacter sp. TaxID=1882438 RepID=UPI003AFFBE35
MLRVQSVWHQYNGQPPLQFQNWAVNQGEQWLLLGNSGSGKTTLMHIITGLLKPTAGDIIIGDQLVYGLPAAKLDAFRGRNIGIVFQQPHLISSLTVTENLLIAQHFAGLPQDKKRIEEVLVSLNMADKRSIKPQQLSQGQMQRIAIARAVINKPALLVADEPTSSLDDVNTKAVLDLLIQQSELNHATLIIATHDHRVKEKFTLQYTLNG